MEPVHLMEKLDALSPWHSLKVFYKDPAWAKMLAVHFAAQRKPGEQYPQYAVNGMKY